MKLVTWRKQRGLSQSECAELFSVTRLSVVRYENGRIPDREIMRRIDEITDGQVSPNDWLESLAAE